MWKLTFVQKQQLARDLGLAMFRTGLYGGWGFAFAGTLLEWNWISIATGVAFSVCFALYGVVAMLCGCRNPPADSGPGPSM